MRSAFALLALCACSTLCACQGTTLSQPAAQMAQACETWATTKLTMAALINADALNPASVQGAVDTVNKYCEDPTPPSSSTAVAALTIVEGAMTEAQQTFAAKPKSN